MFWSKNTACPITEDDRLWVEDSMLFLIDMFGDQYVKDKQTVLPTKDFFNYDFKGDEGDAHFVLNKLYDLMDIDGADINVYLEKPSLSSYELNGTASGGISTSWKGAAGTYQDNGTGAKYIRIDPESLKNTQSLVSTLAHELCHYKLLGEQRIQENDEYLTDLTVIVFGLGICLANSVFSFSQWTSASRQGWNMSKKGYLPEPVIGYALAWLAYYKEDDTNKYKHLNKTVKKYFTDSCNFIQENGNKVKFEN